MAGMKQRKALAASMAMANITEEVAIVADIS